MPFCLEGANGAMGSLPELKYLGVNALKTKAPPPVRPGQSPTVIGPWENVCSDFNCCGPCGFLVCIASAYFVTFCSWSDCCRQWDRADTPGGCSCAPTGEACGCTSYYDDSVKNHPKWRCDESTIATHWCCENWNEQCLFVRKDSDDLHEWRRPGWEPLQRPRAATS